MSRVLPIRKFDPNTDDDYGDLVDQFLHKYKSGNTRVNYRYPIVEFFREVCGVENITSINKEVIKRVSLPQVEEYFLNKLEKLNTKGYSPSAIQIRKASLTSFFNYLIKKFKGAIIVENHFDDYIINEMLENYLPNTPSVPKGDYLTDIEMDALLEEVEKLSIKDDYFLIKFLFKGLRSQEARGIRFNDFYQYNGEWFLLVREDISKNGEARNIALPPKLIEEMNEWYYGCTVGISKKNVFPISKTTIYRKVKKYAEKLFPNKKITPHSLRHSAATYCALENCNSARLMGLFGWKSMRTAERYTHMNIQHKENAGRLLFRF